MAINTEEQSGYDAIQATIPQAPYAKRKIIRGPDGTPQVILVDMSGNPISDPSGYGILEPGNYLDPSTLQAPASPSATSGKTAPEPSTAQRVIRNTAEGGRDNTGGSGGIAGRSQSNNFGYIDKPGLVGAAGMLPGPAGLAGKAVNAGINANNVAAVNAARESMGLPSLGLGGTVKGVVKDNKGQIADVTMSGSTYATPVGLEAMSPTGMTNMTPAEAAARARAVGGMTISTPAEISARNAAFEAEFSRPGLLGRISNVATSFLDNMFGVSPNSYTKYDPVAHARTVNQNSGKNFNPTNDGFANMIGAPSKGSAGANGGSRSSSAGRASNPNTSGNMGKGAGTTSGHGPGIGSA